MSIQYKTIIPLVFIFCLLNGCSGLSGENKYDKPKCITPIITLSFPMEGFNPAPISNEILPSEPWQKVTSIPDPWSVDELSYNELSPQLARTKDGKVEIWVMSQWSKKQSSISNHSIFVFRPSEGKWLEIPAIIEEVKAEIIQLYLGHDGTIWAKASTEIGNAYDYISSGLTKTPYVFGKFNETENRFEQLNFSSDIPLGNGSYNQDKFWLFADGGAIYSIDFRSLEISKYVDPRFAFWDEGYYSTPVNYLTQDDSLAFLEDGSFYFLDETSYNYYVPQIRNLYYFNPASNKGGYVPIKLENGPPFFDIYIDHSENLWISDQGWMDKAGKWNEIIRSPVFITTRLEATPIIWEHPKILFQSSNGWFWYKSSNGLVSLDPKVGDWCWFTTFQSDIVEDAAGNLWLIADGKLYKTEIGD